MDDMISRQVAITAIQKAYADTVRGMDKCAVWKNVGLTNALHIMQDLPSVQTEKMQLSKEDATKGTTFDCISRQAAIDALNKMKIYRPLDSDRYVISDCLNKIVNLPSAQPEPLTDKEQRIFLAAMGREEKVCKQVDDEYRDCMEPYEDSLVRICHEITRKVKGALWT